MRAGLSAGLRVSDEPAYVERTFAMGEPLVDVTKAGMLAAALEDEETLRKLRLRK